MHRPYLLIANALGEGGTGLLALVSPSALLVLFLGIDQASPEVTFFARIAGAALLGLGVACWLGRSDKLGPAQFGLLIGLLVYDVTAVGILAYTGLFSGLVGIVLWPAVVLHAALAVWCVVCLREKPGGEGIERSAPTP
jgi:hypothetical protein